MVSIAQNAFHVTGKVTEVKKLGKISDAFKAGGGGTIRYQDGKVTMHAGIELSKAVDGLATGSRDRKSVV